MTPARQRQARTAQAKHRGSVSHKTELENVLLLLAWESEGLSEGQMVAILNIDRVTIRRMREAAIDRAMALAESLLPERRQAASVEPSRSV